MNSKLYIETPQIYSPHFTKAQNLIALKLENLQPTGSFKLRGLSFLCLNAQKSGAQGFISSSGGNAGLATAYCGAQLKLKTTVVVPKPTPKKCTRSYNATRRTPHNSW